MIKASCDHNFTAMEEMHRKLIDDLQQQHQTEVAALLKEKDQLLQEETAATMAGKILQQSNNIYSIIIITLNLLKLIKSIKAHFFILF